MKNWKRNVVESLASVTEKGWSVVPLRLIVGFGFAAHGLAKLQRGPDHFVDLLVAIGTPAPELLGWLTILFELIGGIALMVGAFTRYFCLPLAVILLVAIFTVHLPYGFSSIKLVSVTPDGAKFGPVGYELNLLYLVCLIVLFIGGSGRFSVDARRV
jgi:putative oxidoreductase